MTPAAEFAAAAGALALGVAAALPSLAVGKREGATGAVLDFAGVTAAGGLLLVHAHLFTSGAPALWAAALFAAGLAAGRAPAKKLLALIAAALGRLSSAEGALGAALSRLMMVCEAYPDLKSDRHMAQVMEELSSAENKVSDGIWT